MSVDNKEAYDLEVIAGLLGQDDPDTPLNEEASREKKNMQKSLDNEVLSGDTSTGINQEISRMPNSATKNGGTDTISLGASSLIESALKGKDLKDCVSPEATAPPNTGEVECLAEPPKSSLDAILLKHKFHAISDSSESGSAPDLESSSSEDNTEGEEGESEESEEDSSTSESEESSSSSSELSCSPDSSSDSPDQDNAEKETPREQAKKHKRNKTQLDAINRGGQSESESDEEGNNKTAIPATAHEITAPAVTMPSITEISLEETMLFVGEVLNVVDSVVVVKSFENGINRVLDTGSLLVLEDRKVLGLIFETFGPLTAPFYSVRFPSASYLPAIISAFVSAPPTERPHVKVYHTPHRSTYAYTSALLLHRGNDASNLYDEEVGENELEFSDDEKEAEWKRRIGGNKRKRQGSRVGSRDGSVARDTIAKKEAMAIEEDAVLALSYDDPYEGVDGLGTSSTRQGGPSFPHQAGTSAPKMSFNASGGRIRGRGHAKGRGVERAQRGGRTRHFGVHEGRTSGLSNTTLLRGAYPHGYPDQSMEYDPRQFASTHSAPNYAPYMALPSTGHSGVTPHWNGPAQCASINPQAYALGMGFPANGAPMAMGMGTPGPLPGAHINPHFAMMHMFEPTGAIQGQVAHADGYSHEHPPGETSPR